MKNTDAKIFDILLAYGLLREESADMSDISRAFSWLSQADAAKRAGDTRKFASLLRSAASSLGKAANAAEKQFEDELARLERKEIKKLYEEINGMGLLEECIKETVEKIEIQEGTAEADRCANRLSAKFAKLKAGFELSTEANEITKGIIESMLGILTPFIYDDHTVEGAEFRRKKEFEILIDLLPRSAYFSSEKAGDESEFDKEV